MGVAMSARVLGVCLVALPLGAGDRVSGHAPDPDRDSAPAASPTGGQAVGVSR